MKTPVEILEGFRDQYAEQSRRLHLQRDGIDRAIAEATAKREAILEAIQKITNGETPL